MTGDDRIDALIVEDSRTQAKWMRMILEARGFSVREANDGESALEEIASAPPDVVVSDIVMPGIGGYELCRRVKADPALADIPVILVTTLTSPEETINALEAGASNFLAKPYDAETLVARIGQTLRNARLGASEDDSLEVGFAGRLVTLRSNPRQMTGFLVSTYEDAVAKNTQLAETNRQLQDAIQTITRLESRYRDLMDSSAEAMLVVAADSTVLYANNAAERVFQQPAGEIVGTSVPLTTTQNEPLEIEFPLPDGTTGCAEQRVVEIQWGGEPAFLASFWDVTENVRLRERLRELSLTDELTGLHNRRGFMLLAEQQLKIAKRDPRRLMLMYADLDGLKQINDTYGHSAGDAAIAETASLLKDVLRESDIVARMGGDEFAALLIDVAKGSPPAPGPRLVAAFDAHNALQLTPWKLELSIGAVAREPDDPRELEELMHEADELMYVEKARRKAARG